MQFCLEAWYPTHPGETCKTANPAAHCSDKAHQTHAVLLILPLICLIEIKQRWSADTIIEWRIAEHKMQQDPPLSSTGDRQTSEAMAFVSPLQRQKPLCCQID